MWAIFGVFIAALGIIWIEVPTLLRQKQTRELVFFSLFLGVAVLSGITMAMGMDLPNPYGLIEIIYRPIGEWINNLFR
ncbi:hypothetical protein [Risungbinella massiliensis]|uniref:hypothetical protein n=1 Tax=Risungbinella massiliensis TaxID=1329796 RepID=UPI0005CBDE83|nr:hypothetical protein [Risungbinella massiliensis]